MRLVATGLATLALGACMLPIPIGGIGGIGSSPEEARAASASLEAAQTSASANASRPGDASMTCAQIQAESMAQMQDPKFQQAMASMGGRAKDQKAKQDAALAGQKVTPTASDARAPLDTSADIVAMMPQIMRGQELNRLATAKKCDFLKTPKPT